MNDSVNRYFGAVFQIASQEMIVDTTHPNDRRYRHLCHYPRRADRCICLLFHNTEIQAVDRLAWDRNLLQNDT